MKQTKKKKKKNVKIGVLKMISKHNLEMPKEMDLEYSEGKDAGTKKKRN